MQVWSRGLGRVQLGFDLRKVDIIYRNGCLYVVGRTEPPVSWDFVVKISVSEVGLLIKLVMSKGSLRLALKYLVNKLINNKRLESGLNEAVKTKTKFLVSDELGDVLKNRTSGVARWVR